MIDFQTALKNLIDQELNANSNGIEFNVNLYNSPKRRYFRIDKDNGQKIRFVPTLITDISGEYIPIPNVNTTNNNVGIEFELFAGKTDTLSDEEIIEFSTVDYFKSLDSIENFKNNLLAKYFPLGNSQLYFGDEESVLTSLIDTTLNLRNVYFEFTPKNNDEENLFTIDGYLPFKVVKTATNIELYVTSVLKASFPYTVNQEIKILCYLKENNAPNYTWGITDFVTVETITTTEPLYQINSQEVYIGETTGLEGYLKRFILDDTDLTNETVIGSNIDTLITTPSIEFKDFDDRYTVTNLGELSGVTTTVANCILWGDAGNAIFGFDTLIPESVFTTPEGNFYQKFFLNCNALVTNDIIISNVFEYYLSLDGGVTEERIYPVSTQNTMGTELNSAQKINTGKSKSLVEESMIDISNTFYYTPSKKMNKLFRHIMSKNSTQNQIFTLRIQYPFFQETYDVIIDSGGNQQEINSLTSFTVSYKQKSDILTIE